jgi:hypothetical protein
LTGSDETAAEVPVPQEKRERARHTYGLLYRDVKVAGFSIGSVQFELRLPVFTVGRYEDLEPEESDLVGVIHHSHGIITCSFTRA